MGEINNCFLDFYVRRYPPLPAVRIAGPTPTLSPSFLLAEAIFEPNIFPV